MTTPQHPFTASLINEHNAYVAKNLRAPMTHTIAAPTAVEQELDGENPIDQVMNQAGLIGLRVDAQGNQGNR